MAFKFMRSQNALGSGHYEEQGVGGMGLKIHFTSVGISFSGTSSDIMTHKDLSELAKTVSDAWKDHLTLKTVRENEMKI